MFQITLRHARESCGYSIEDAADNLGVTIDALKGYENDTSLIPVKTISKINLLYNVPLMLIFIGTEDNCVLNNRKNQNKISGSK